MADHAEKYKHYLEAWCSSSAVRAVLMRPAAQMLLATSRNTSRTAPRRLIGGLGRVKQRFGGQNFHLPRNHGIKHQTEPGFA